MKIGLKVITTKIDPDTRGMMINPRHLTIRREGARGTVLNYVPGHGGDVWFVQHDDCEELEIAAYGTWEMEELPKTRGERIVEHRL